MPEGKPNNTLNYRVKIATVTPDAEGNILAQEDVTRFLFEIDSNGEVKLDDKNRPVRLKGADGKDLNRLFISEIQEDVGEGKKVSLYKISIVDQQGNTLTSLSSQLQGREMMVVGKTKNQGFGENCCDIVQKYEFDINEIAQAIEDAKKSSRATAPATAEMLFDEGMRPIIKVNVPSENGIDLVVCYAEEPLMPDELPAKPSMGFEKIFKELKSAAENGVLVSAGNKDGELYTKLNKLANEAGASFSKDEAALLIHAYKELVTDGFEPEELATLRQVTDSLGVSGSGQFVSTPGTFGTKVNTGWMVE